MIPMDLRGALALAYLDGLHRRAAEEAARRPADTVRLDTPDRPPVAPLRPRGVCYSGDPRQWCRWNSACRACVRG